ncbi:tetratricopeptide repeat protein [Stappia sp.]|uniref:tetratricopeptide repeat protein n=1 Tax=Stappia sp. TaxID=1870903 RepID=UPI0032D9AB60
MASSSPAPLETMRKALLLQRDGKIARARSLYEKILKKEPGNVEATNLLGLCFLEQGYPKRALNLLERAVRLAPQEARYRLNLLDCLEKLDDLPAVLAATEAALTELADPAPALLHRRALLLRRMGRFAEALPAYEAAVRADPDNVETLVELGQTLSLAEKYEEAVRVFEFALTSAPGHRLAILSLADAFNQIDRASEARDLLRARAEAFNLERDAAYHLSLANSYWGSGDFRLALEEADRAMALGLVGVDSHIVRGKALHGLGRFAEAVEALDTALALDPQRHNAALNLGYSCLAAGDLERGWALAERRVEARLKDILIRHFTTPAWQGEPLAGKTLMVWNDQGIGDVLRSSSMLAELAEQADRVILECPSKLVPLLARNFPQIEVRVRRHDARGRPVGAEDYDVQSSLGALPMYLRPTIDAFPRHESYLTADPQRVRELRARPPLNGPRPKIGLSWTSGKQTTLRARSYLTLADLLPLLQLEGAEFVLLDYTDRSAEIAELQAQTPFTLHRWDDLDLFDDLETAAALTACMDLVISANTSAAELSGALGVPTWRFGPVTGTVLLGQENPPWHPRTRYVRLDPEGAAADIVPTLAADLRSWLDAGE